MKRIRVVLVGETPLLMNSPKAMLEERNPVNIKTQRRDRSLEAESVAYRNDKNNLFVPNTAVKGCMLGASSFKKVGKFTLKPIIAGGVRVFPEEIEVLDIAGKSMKRYEIDLRTVVIQNSRVVKSRPKIKSWKLDFEVRYNEDLIADPEIIKQVLKEGGERVGILDFRPECSGDFGTFKVAKFEVMK